MMALRTLAVSTTQSHIGCIGQGRAEATGTKRRAPTTMRSITAANAIMGELS
jgi:hypothetical protein